MDAATAMPAGLNSKHSCGHLPVPLLGVRARAEIRGTAARLTLAQRFQNDSDLPLEAVYTFPLEEGSAVTGFEVEIGGRRVKGEVEERDRAFKLYDDALAKGHGGYLLDEELPDVFRLSVGNLPPRGEATVTLSVVSELLREGEALRFLLPTTIAPRYAPAEDRVGVGESREDVLNPPRELAVPYGLDFQAEIDLGRPLRSVESPTHPITVELLDGNRARVSLGARLAAMDRDLVLLVTPREAGQPQALVERDPRGGWAAQLSFAPLIEAASAPSEVVFVIDCSGSMEGQSIDEARSALQLCLASLTPAQRFDIVRFGSTWQRLFGESRPYDQASLEAARTFVGGLKADLGGTEILKALASVVVQELVPGLPRQLVVLTDGQVTNTDEVVRLLRRQSGDTRVFTFGIGAGVDSRLVKGMARAGEGAAEFIAPGERLEPKVLRQLRRLMTPAYTDVRVDWDGASPRQAPHLVPPVFADGRVIVYGLGDGDLPKEAALRARGPLGEVEWRLPIDAAAAGEGTLLGTLAARALIRDLEEGMSPLHTRRGSLQQRGRSAQARVDQEVVALAKAYGLASRHTSFVAVEQREAPTEGGAVLVKVPIALQRGWGGQPAAPARACACMARVSQMASPSPAGLKRAAVSREALTMADRDEEMAMTAESLDEAEQFELGQAELLARDTPRRLLESESDGEPLATPATGPQPAGRSGPLGTLVALQRFDGSWDLTEKLAGFLGRKLGELLARIDAQNHQARKALATALALAWLEREAADRADEWSLLAEKARRWLDACGVAPEAGTWPALAEALLEEQAAC